MLTPFHVPGFDADSHITKAEFKLLKHQCGYWDFPKNDDINIIDIKYVLRFMVSSANNKKWLSI